MNRKILLFLLILPLLYAQITEECVRCEEVAALTPTKMVVISDEINHVLRVSLYNATSRQPLPNAVIIVYRYNNETYGFEKLFTDESGSAVYNFSRFKDECYTYQVLFCSCDNDAVKKCCFEINKIDITKSNIPDAVDGIPLAPGQPQPDPSEIVYNYNAFPSTEVYSYCKPSGEATATPAFCLPLAIIFALLGGSLMLSGRNPLRGFDLGGVRVGKHIKYESRGRFAGYTVSVAQVTGVVRKAKAEKIEKAEAKEAEKGAGGAIAARFGRQVIMPIKRVPAGLTQAKGAMAAARQDLAKGGLKGVAAQYVEAGKLLGRAAIQAVGTPIDILRTSTGGPEMMIGPDGKLIPVRRGVEAKGEGVSGIFAVLAAIVPGIDAKKLQDRTYELLTTKGELMAAQFTLQEKIRAVQEMLGEVSVSKLLKGMKGKVFFTAEQSRPKSIGEDIIVGETKTPDGKNAVTVKKPDGSLVALEGTPKYREYIQALKESEGVVGRIRIDVPGKGTYFIASDKEGLHVYKGDYEKGEGKEITASKLGKAMLAAYTEITRAKKDFEIGEKSGALIRYNEAMAEMKQAQQTLLNMQMAFVKSNLEKIKRDFLEQPGTVEKSDEVVIKRIERAKEMMENEVRKIARKGVGIDPDKYKTKDGGINLDQLLVAIEKKGGERIHKEELHDFSEPIQNLAEAAKLIKDYGAATTPEKIREAKREAVERYVIPRKEETGEKAKVEQEIRKYIEKVGVEIRQAYAELAKGVKNEDELNRKREYIGELQTIREYLGSRIEEDKEKAVSIAVNQMNKDEAEETVRKNPRHPFAGMVALSDLTGRIEKEYEKIYSQPDYGEADETGRKKTLEYEDWVNKVVASEAAALEIKETNEERTKIMAAAISLLNPSEMEKSSKKPVQQPPQKKPAEKKD